MKECKNCKKIKPLEDFPNGSKYKGKQYISNICKICRNALSLPYQKSYRTLNKDKVRENERRYRKERYMLDRNYRKRVRRKEAERRPRYRIKIMLERALQRAKKNNLTFNLEEKDIIIPKTCPILEIPIFYGTKNNYQNSPSLDRINNRKGYTKDNIKIISSKANTMKSNASKKLLLTFCKNMPKYLDFKDIVQTNENLKLLEIEDKEPQ